MLKTLVLSIICLASSGVVTDSCPARSVTEQAVKYSIKAESDQTPRQIDPWNEYEADTHRLIALRSHSLEELLTLANQLENKWRRINWQMYARIMIKICSEISNRGLKDGRARGESEGFAKTALSHSLRYSWEHEADLVGYLVSRVSPADPDWVRERREKTALWLRAWRRLEREFDPSYDPSDRKNNISLRVYPPVETGLPPGTPPSAIKDPKLRAKYVAALAENKRKSQKAAEQIPLIRDGRAFKARAEHILIYLYSQSPSRGNELKWYLETYIKDAPARKRMLDAVAKNTG